MRGGHSQAGYTTWNTKADDSIYKTTKPITASSCQIRAELAHQFHRFTTPPTVNPCRQTQDRACIAPMRSEPRLSGKDPVAQPTHRRTYCPSRAARLGRPASCS